MLGIQHKDGHWLHGIKLILGEQTIRNNYVRMASKLEKLEEK